MNKIKCVVVNSLFIWVAIFVSLEGKDYNAEKIKKQQKALEKEIKRLENSLGKLQKQLDDTDKEKIKVEEKKKKEKQSFDKTIDNIHKKNSEERDKKISKLEKSIEQIQVEINGLSQKNKQAKDAKTKQKIDGQIKQKKDKITKLKKEVNQVKKVAESNGNKKISDAEKSFKKKESGFSEILENLEKKFLKIQKEIDETNERLLTLRNRYNSLENGDSLQENDSFANVSENPQKEYSSSTANRKEKVGQVMDIPQKEKLVLSLEKKIVKNNEKINKLVKKKDLVNTDLQELTMKNKPADRKKVDAELVKLREVWTKKNNATIAKNNAVIVKNNRRISKIDLCIEKEKNKNKAEKLKKEKNALLQQNDSLENINQTLAAGENIDKEINKKLDSFEKNYASKISVVEKKIAAFEQDIEALQKDNVELEDNKEYLKSHSLEEYVKYTHEKDKKLGKFPYSLSFLAFDDVFAQRDKEEKEKKEKEAGKTEKKEKADTAKLPDNTTKSKLISMDKLNLSVKLPNCKQPGFPVVFMLDSNFVFDFTKSWNEDIYRKFSVRLKLGIPKINLTNVKPTDHALFGPFGERNGYQPLEIDFFLRRLSVVWKPFYIAPDSLVTLRGGLKEFNVGERNRNVGQLFVTAKTGLWKDKFFVKIGWFSCVDRRTNSNIGNSHYFSAGTKWENFSLHFKSYCAKYDAAAVTVSGFRYCDLFRVKRVVDVFENHADKINMKYRFDFMKVVDDQAGAHTLKSLRFIINCGLARNLFGLLSYNVRGRLAKMVFDADKLPSWMNKWCKTFNITPIDCELSNNVQKDEKTLGVTTMKFNLKIYSLILAGNIANWEIDVDKKSVSWLPGGSISWNVLDFIKSLKKTTKNVEKV